jgi:hypothetical protein
MPPCIFRVPNTIFSLKIQSRNPLNQKQRKTGFCFVFDLKELENTRFLKLVSFPTYSYFC